MLSIRLRREGASKDPHYRVVVAEHSAARDGRFLEILGHYHPSSEPADIDIDVERANYWIARGAKVSDTVRTLIKKVEKQPAASTTD